MTLVRIRDQGICAHPAASKPALLCNPPAHTTNPPRRAEFRPNAAAPAFITAYLINWIIFSFTAGTACKPFQMRTRVRHFPETSECPVVRTQTGRFALSGRFPPPLRLDRQTKSSPPTAGGKSRFWFGLLFEHLCEKPPVSDLFHVTEPKLSADFIFVQYPFYNFLQK